MFSFEIMTLKPTSVGEHADCDLDSAGELTVYRSEDVEVKGTVYPGLKSPDSEGK